ncbi:MBL fold metallo-hydrolase [Roseobacteraceae bacterium S113]
MLPPRPASPAALAPGLTRLIAPNPSPMTYWGTNTYLLGHRDIAVIDPGPADAAHLDAIETALPDGATITHILVTHAHLDHSPGARPLAERTGAEIYAFGSAQAGRSKVMEQLARAGLAGGGEGVDSGFSPDHVLTHGAQVRTHDWELRAIHTPGHMGNHLSFAWGDALFCGDLVMGWASSLVSPPDGDLTDFMASCRLLQQTPWARFYAGHGDPIEAPNDRLDWLIGHREAREAQILNALSQGPATAQGLAHAIYTDTPAALLPAATRNVFAHLVDLHGKSQVTAAPHLSPEAEFTRVA